MKTLTLSLAGLLLGAVPALAQDLIMSSWLPPRHPIMVNAIEPWAEEVAQVTEGRVTVRIMARPLGTPPAHFDMARDGVADITYGLHSFTEDDRFERAKLGQFSFLGDDAIEASVAYWDLYGGTLDAAAEHPGTHLLGLFLHGPGLLHNNLRRIETPSDIEGMKIRVPGGYSGEVIEAMGGAALFMSPSEVYERLSRGVIDGVTFTYEALTAYNLTDHVRFSMTTPGGIYNNTWFLVMNGDRWDGLSEEDRAAIDAISGEAFARRVGQAWNDADQAARDEVEGRIEFYEAGPEVLTALREVTSGLEAEWAAGLGEGYDGLAALAAFRQRTGVEIE